MDVDKSISFGPRGVITNDDLEKLSFSDKYEIIETLGKGGFGVVYKVKEKSSDLIFAAKGFFLHKDSGDSHLYEIRTMREFNGECAGYFKEAFFDIDENRYYVIMEYLQGIDLKGYKESDKPKDFGFIAPLFEKIYDCLKKFHSIGYVHRDVKLQNIMFTGDDIKLIDFGLSVKYTSDSKLLRKMAGTPLYMNDLIMPHKLKTYPKSKLKEIWKFNDMWCLIITFYNLSTGYDIYSKRGGFPELFKRVGKRQLKLKYDSETIKDQNPLVKLCIRIFRAYVLNEKFDINDMIEAEIKKW
jgi:serine/threonine protein kinase